FSSAVHKNVSLDARSLEFLRRLNRWYPPFIEGHLNPHRQRLVSAVHRIAGGQPGRMDRELALEFQKRYREGNARIAQEYLGRADGRLFFEKPGDDPEQAPGLAVDDAIEIAARLWAVAHNVELSSMPSPRSKSLHAE